MKIKFDSDHNLPLNKTLKFRILTIIIRSIFEKNGKYYPQISLDDTLYDVQMFEYERIDVSEGIDVNKSDESKECDICHYWYFLDKNFNYEPYLCNGCHDLIQKAINFNNVAVASVKGNSYRIHFWSMTKDNAINLLNTSALNNKGML